MYAKYVQKGESLDYIPGSDVSAGDVVIQGNIVGIAKLDIKANTLGSVSLVGVYDIAKATGDITAGAVVYWDATHHNVTTTSTNNTKIGLAVDAAASGATIVRVLLNA